MSVGQDWTVRRLHTYSNGVLLMTTGTTNEQPESPMPASVGEGNTVQTPEPVGSGNTPRWNPKLASMTNTVRSSSGCMARLRELAPPAMATAPGAGPPGSAFHVSPPSVEYQNPLPHAYTR